jgi:biopolymer transport protein ExbD
MAFAAPPRRRALSLTPLVDVIFLLLLFFMLTSTFSRFGEVELTAATRGAGAGQSPMFLQLGEDRARLNGEDVALDAVAAAAGEGVLLVSLDPGTTSQRLVDLLAALRGAAVLSVTVLE